MNLDKETFEKFYHHYYPRLCRYTERIVGSTETSEDLVQNVFLNIWKNRNSCNISSITSMYLYKAMRNQVINYIKRKNIYFLYDSCDVEYLEVDNYTPENKLIDKECLKKMHTLLTQLPESCRLIFKLKKIYGLKYKEIADIMEISEKTVENQMGKALKFMREKLKFIFLVDSAVLLNHNIFLFL